MHAKTPRWLLAAPVALLAMFMVPALSSAADNEVVFGLIQPLTAQGATIGQGMVRGVELALEHINAAGGVLGGKKLTYIVEDDQCNPPTAVSAAKKLINQNHVKIIVGAMCSSATMAIMPVTREAEVLHIVPLSYHPDITEKGQPYLFRTCITSNTNREFVDFMVEKTGVKRVALLGVNDDFGRGELGVFAKRFEALGAKVVSTEFFRFEDRDFSIYLAKIKAAKPDGIYIVARSPQHAMIVNQMKEMNFSPKIFGSGNFSDQEFVNLTKQNGDGVYAVVDWSKDIDNPTNRKFVEAYKAKYGNYDGANYAEPGYTAVLVLADAINRAGTASDVPKLGAAMKKVHVPVPWGPLSFDEKGQARVHVFPVQLKNGEFGLVKQ